MLHVVEGPLLRMITSELDFNTRMVVCEKLRRVSREDRATPIVRVLDSDIAVSRELYDVDVGR